MTGFDVQKQILSLMLEQGLYGRRMTPAPCLAFLNRGERTERSSTTLKQ
jgi:hypothetical protein